MKKIVEFQTSASGNPGLILPWNPSPNQYEDLILTPECRGSKARLPEGTCTIRVLPAIKDSRHWWLPISALCYSGGQHAHPKNTDPSKAAQSVFDLARAWFRQNAPKALFTKASGKGFKLWTQPMATCWLLVTHKGQTNLKLLLASAFAGATGQKSGLAHQIMEFVVANPQLLNPDARYEIEVSRAFPQGSSYLNTELRLIESEHSLNESIADLPSQQIRMVCPLEQTIRRIEPEDEWKLLEKAIGSQWVERIRSTPQPTIT